jgi:mannose-6-phosphate isomerase-like protein (cupin superfamily)
VRPADGHEFGGHDVGPGGAQAEAGWFLDALVVEHRRAPPMASVVLEMTMPVGHAPALHVHDDLDDTWYVLEGQMAVRCGDEEFFVEGDAWVSMPRGVPHSFRVVGEQPARILAVHDNATLRDFVRELGVPTVERVPPPTPSFPAIEELARVAGKHDLRPIGPPLTADQTSAIMARTANLRQPTSSIAR